MPLFESHNPFVSAIFSKLHGVSGVLDDSKGGLLAGMLQGRSCI